MKHAVISVAVLAVMTFSAQAALSSGPAVIAFGGLDSGNGPLGIWVMDKDGDNKTLAYESCPG